VRVRPDLSNDQPAKISERRGCLSFSDIGIANFVAEAL